MTKAQRKAIKATLGPSVQRIRISTNGSNAVDAYGPMPNATHIVGWYFVGWAETLLEKVAA